MAGVYRPRHPERTILYRVLFHYLDLFLVEYEGRFEKQCGFLRPIIKEVIERYLDCGNPRCGFARIRCPDCRMLRIFFKYNRCLLGELCRSALRSLIHQFAAVTGSELRPGVIAAIQTFGDRINFHPHLHFLVTKGGVTRPGSSRRSPG